MLRACFVRAEAEATDGARQVLEDGFLVLRMLAEQQRLQACSSLRVSSGVRIECHCALAEPPPEGDPGKNALGRLVEWGGLDIRSCSSSDEFVNGVLRGRPSFSRQSELEEERRHPRS